MTRLRVAIYDAKFAMNALHRAGIACEAVSWGNVVYLEVKDADAKQAREVVREWRLLAWWERVWERVRGGMSYTLHLGDCLEVLPGLAAGSVDAVITDPPYGISHVRGEQKYHGAAKWATRFHGTPILGDNAPFDPRPFLFAPTVIMFGANNFADKLPPSRGWIFWHKRAWMAPNDFGDGEMIWTNQDRVIRYVDHRWSGVLRASENGKEHCHPTQKPVAVMRLLIRDYTQPGSTILDPFMGSGTTIVAAILEGRNAIGIELDPAYHAIAARRCADAAAQPPLFPPAALHSPAPTQAELLAHA